MGLERVSADVIGMKDASARTSGVGLWEPVNVESFLASGRCIPLSISDLKTSSFVQSLAYSCHSPTKQHVPTFLALPPHCHAISSPHSVPPEGHALCGAGAPTLQSSTSAASVLLSPSRPCLHLQESLSNVVPTAVYLE
ncbi:hypothetical protein D9757_014821 [Collybiopsis confluens]|uniref:Uncharacterized protein n=1 Tax=Collybiopsis confluens TaxID=2823264 RepID=A0A8H5CJC2_9AGAR|nr:hypothetical protein D9757_014821 [Collybiopsis confluens]